LQGGIIEGISRNVQILIHEFIRLEKMDNQNELTLLRHKIQQEISKREQAEAALAESRQELSLLKQQLEEKIAARTKALKESEMRYRQIVENATDIIYRVDGNGMYSYTNQTALTRLGYTKEEMLERHYLDLVHPDWKEEVANFYRNCRDNNQINSYFEFPILTKSGEAIWLAQNVQFIRKGDKIVEATAVARDSTKRKLAEVALKTSESRLTSLIANLQSGILVEDETHHIVFVNQLYCDQFKLGVSAESFIGADCSQASQQVKHLLKNPDEFVEGVRKLLTDRQITMGDELLMADGSFLQRDYIPIITEGKYMGHLWQYRDVTREKLTAETLKRSEEKYRGIIENMELGLLEVDTIGQIVKANKSFCEMTSYAEVEIVGQNAVEVFLPPEFYPVIKQQDKDRLEGKAGIYEMQLFKKDGSRIWVMVSGAPIYDHRGRVVGTIGIHYDITRQRQLQQKLFEARLQAEEAQEAEKEFLANMSHEIRTPLNAVIGMAHLLHDTTLTAQQKEFLNALKSAADILQSLISDVLDIAKIKSGKMEVNPREFNVLELVQGILNIFENKIAGKPVKVYSDIDPNLKTLLVGDDLMLKQILLNLLGNAEKFTQEGYIGITLFIIHKNKDRWTLRFEVSDTGFGIPKDKIELIFQSFRQMDNDIKQKFGGTGLGLAIVKDLIELQNGSIWVNSEEGVGSIFSFELAYDDTGKPAIQQQSATNWQHLRAVEPLTILVVEDSSMNRMYVSNLLEKWGISYKMAFNGRIACEMVKEERFEVILLDIQMPEMDGYETAEVIRNTDNPNRETPIIALSASAMLNKKEKAIEVGMNDHVSKPFNPEQLHAVLAKHVKMLNEIAEVPPVPSPSIAEQRPKFEIDKNYLSDYYGGDVNYSIEMFTLFFEKMEREYPLLRLHFEAKEWKAMSAIAHKLKPAFPMVGLPRIEPYFSNLESLTKAANIDENEVEKVLLEIEGSVAFWLPLVKGELNHLKSLVEV
jgi:PAS domain S-box-containing protein